MASNCIALMAIYRSAVIKQKTAKTDLNKAIASATAGSKVNATAKIQQYVSGVLISQFEETFTSHRFSIGNGPFLDALNVTLQAEVSNYLAISLVDTQKLGAAVAKAETVLKTADAAVRVAFNNCINNSCIRI